MYRTEDFFTTEDTEGTEEESHHRGSDEHTPLFLCDLCVLCGEKIFLPVLFSVLVF
jgi:hypothetical protein